MKLDLLIINANIVTVDDNRPQASSIGIYRDRIIFVGNDQDAKRYDTKKVINATGKTIVPGFNDAHQHMSHFGDSLRRVNLSSPPIESIQDILDAVASRAAFRFRDISRDDDHESTSQSQQPYQPLQPST